MDINWKWPAKNGNQFFPWYIILLLIPGTIVYFIGLYVSCFGLFISGGYNSMKQYYNSRMRLM